MFHNPFRSTSPASNREPRTSSTRSSNKGTQTYSMRSRGTQTSPRLRRPDKKTQTSRCIAKPKKAYKTAGTQTGLAEPGPTKPRFPPATYRAERRFPEFNGSATESSEQTEVDLYAFAGGYGSSQIQSLDPLPASSRPDETNHDYGVGGKDELCSRSDSSYMAVFSSPSS